MARQLRKIITPSAKEFRYLSTVIKSRQLNTGGFTFEKQMPGCGNVFHFHLRLTSFC